MCHHSSAIALSVCIFHLVISNIQCNSCQNQQSTTRRDVIAFDSITLLHSGCSSSNQWYKDGHELDISQSDRYSTTISGSLMISNVTAADEGLYQCQSQLGSSEGSCLVVRGRAVFRNCTSYSSDYLQCNDNHQLNVTAGQSIVLPTRIAYINGGTEKQSIVQLRIFKESFVYDCDQDAVQCEDSMQWSVTRYSQSQEKYDIELELRQATVSDSGEYIIAYDLVERSGQSTLTWRIDVSVADPGMPSGPTTTERVTSGPNTDQSETTTSTEEPVMDATTTSSETSTGINGPDVGELGTGSIEGGINQIVIVVSCVFGGVLALGILAMVILGVVLGRKRSNKRDYVQDDGQFTTNRKTTPEFGPMYSTINTTVQPELPPYSLNEHRPIVSDTSVSDLPPKLPPPRRADAVNLNVDVIGNHIDTYSTSGAGLLRDMNSSTVDV